MFQEQLTSIGFTPGGSDIASVALARELRELRGGRETPDPKRSYSALLTGADGEASDCIKPQVHQPTSLQNTQTLVTACQKQTVAGVALQLQGLYSQHPYAQLRCNQVFQVQRQYHGIQPIDELGLGAKFNFGS